MKLGLFSDNEDEMGGEDEWRNRHDRGQPRTLRYPFPPNSARADGGCSWNRSSGAPEAAGAAGAAGAGLAASELCDAPCDRSDAGVHKSATTGEIGRASCRERV